MDGNHSWEDQIENLNFLESLHHDYQTQSRQFDQAWQTFFQDVEKFSDSPSLAPSLESSSIFSSCQKERIEHLMNAYRRDGHLLAFINPLELKHLQEIPQLNLKNLGFQEKELKEIFPTLGLLKENQASLEEIIKVLKRRYCQTIGFEFKDFTNVELEDWLQKQIESSYFDQPFNSEEKHLILNSLIRAELLESFLHTKHVGKKRFSLEGAETLIPMLNFLVNKGAMEEIKEIFIGMSHRGRLNVLANILNKSFQSIFQDFDEDYDPAPTEGMGDIRYHKGHANEAVKTYQGYSIKLTMASNPSHLESVDPVIEGQTRAKQVLIGDEPDRKRIIPLLIHGDAALSGQGVVYETLQLNRLAGYETGGTIHIVINNQIGFTTDPKNARSTLYCTDIAYTFGIPVFHINAEDPENCVRVILLALEIRQRFHCDVFIDLNCYRKYGHNEGDEPAFTQPLAYQLIRKKKTIREIYLNQLLSEGMIDKKQEEEEEEKIKQALKEAYQMVTSNASDKNQPYLNPLSSIQFVETKVNLELLKTVSEHFSKIPSHFHPHAKLKHLMKERLQAVQKDQTCDWGLAEYLAYATLLWEGTPIRLSGQDSGRGTFSHRHALWVDQENNQEYFPLAHLNEKQGRCEIINSCLSEEAALGFEYGYSTVYTKGLTIWEAQFGDFVNSAQVIIDQYIASGEQKWGQTSNLVLFLPHGFEGQGPEHSSGRLERFLALSGHDNMQISYPTTPAQIFHLLRQQVKQSWRKPLIIFTPKGLLRHPACVSRISDLTQGNFLTILDDPFNPKQVKRVVLCSGRVYYDLEAQRMKNKREDIALIRIEQLYPLDEKALKEIFQHYPQMKECQWVQEEPENMGAWSFISPYLRQILPSGISLIYVGRERSATPATGFYARHKQEQEHLLSQVFANEK